MGEKRFKFALDGRKRKRILTDVSPYSSGGLRTVRFDYRGIFEFRLTCRAEAWFQPESLVSREEIVSLPFEVRFWERRLYEIRCKREKRDWSIEKFWNSSNFILNVLIDKFFFSFSNIFFFFFFFACVYKLLYY